MNATQLAGIIAFSGAGLMCFRARWWLLGATHAALALECVFGLRHHVHNLAVDMMGPLYAERAGVQIALLGVAMGLVGMLAVLLLRRKQRLSSFVATAATLLAIGLFSIEVISLHAIDAVLYRFVGGIMVIGWIWIGLALTVATGALRALSLKGVSASGTANHHSNQ